MSKSNDNCFFINMFKLCNQIYISIWFKLVSLPLHQSLQQSEGMIHISILKSPMTTVHFGIPTKISTNQSGLFNIFPLSGPSVLILVFPKGLPCWQALNCPWPSLRGSLRGGPGWARGGRPAAVQVGYPSSFRGKGLLNTKLESCSSKLFETWVVAQ